MEDAAAVDFASGDDAGSPGEGIDGQEGKDGGGGGELGVGGGSEELAVVEAVERLAVERGYADAEVGVGERWIGKNGGDAAG